MLPRSTIAVNGRPLEETPRARFDETQQLEIACSPVPGARAAELRVGDVDLGPPSSTFGDPLWSWSWQPQQAAGVFPALLRVTGPDGAVEETPFELRIVPSKLDAEHYEQLIGELQRDAAAIVWALAGGRVGATPAPGAGPRGLIEEYALLVERLAAEAATVCDLLLDRPHERLRSDPAPVPLAEAVRIEPAALAHLGREPLDEVAGELMPRLQRALRPRAPRGGPLPRELPGVRTRRTVDIVEHRLLKHVLRTVVWRLDYIRDLLRREAERRAANRALLGAALSTRALNERRARCAAAARGLRRRLELPFFEAVGAFAGAAAATHLQLHDPRYRRLAALFRQLRAAPFAAFEYPALWLPIAELPALYEQWCLLRLVRALLPLGTLVRQTLLEHDGAGGIDGRWTLRLRSHRPLLELRLPDGARVALRYQRRYAPGARGLGTLDAYVRIPDAAIEVSRGGSLRALIFDAKYRVDPDGRAPQDALDDAYAYRGAIGAGTTRATIGSFLLFPGTVRLETADLVGALPLIPGQADGLDELVQRLLGAGRDE